MIHVHPVDAALRGTGLHVWTVVDIFPATIRDGAKWALRVAAGSIPSRSSRQGFPGCASTSQETETES